MASYYGGAVKGDGGNSSGLLMVVVLVVVIAGVAYYVIHRKSDDDAQNNSSPSGDADATSATNKPAPPPVDQAANDKAMAECNKLDLPTGTCRIDPATNKVFLHCNDQRYGENCEHTCETDGNKSTKYTPGFETGSGTPATCVCPAGYMFSNRDVRTGCMSGSAKGSKCESGYHGINCDKKGSFKFCGTNGTQDPTTGDCSCINGYVGPTCQYPSNYCTSKDSGATQNTNNWMCTCSEGWIDSKCTTLEEGYVVSAKTNNMAVKESTLCLNNGAFDKDTGLCTCPAPYAGKKCELQVNKCYAKSSKNCKANGTHCTWGDGWMGCDACKEKNNEFCCSDNHTGCGAGQRATCVDKNTYPCTADDVSPRTIMISGGKQASPSDILNFTTDDNAVLANGSATS